MSVLRRRTHSSTMTALSLLRPHLLRLHQLLSHCCSCVHFSYCPEQPTARKLAIPRARPIIRFPSSYRCECYAVTCRCGVGACVCESSVRNLLAARAPLIPRLSPFAVEKSSRAQQAAAILPPAPSFGRRSTCPGVNLVRHRLSLYLHRYGIW